MPEEIKLLAQHAGLGSPPEFYLARQRPRQHPPHGRSTAGEPPAWRRKRRRSSSPRTSCPRRNSHEAAFPQHSSGRRPERSQEAVLHQTAKAYPNRIATLDSQPNSFVTLTPTAPKPDPPTLRSWPTNPRRWTTRHPVAASAPLLTSARRPTSGGVTCDCPALCRNPVIDRQ